MLSEKLTEIKSQTDALLNYANETTKAEDTRLGDAIRRLADGFGGGSPNYGITIGNEIPITIVQNEYLSNGRLLGYNGWDRTGKIEIDPNKTYKIQVNGCIDRKYIALYNDEGVFVRIANLYVGGSMFVKIGDSSCKNIAFSEQRSYMETLKIFEVNGTIQDVETL